MECVSYNIEYGRFVCLATENETCDGTECAFYKTSKQAKEAREKAYERIRTLPEETQEQIADTYYDGFKPWKT